VVNRGSASRRGAFIGISSNSHLRKNVDNTAVYMELWVDGQKGSTNELRTTVTVTPGRHALGLAAVDAAGNKATKTAEVTLQ